MLPDQTSASGTDQATTDRLAAFKAACGALELASVILPSPNAEYCSFYISLKRDGHGEERQRRVRCAGQCGQKAVHSNAVE